MKIIIEIKESAKLERIARFSKYLEELRTQNLGFPDVIADISKEW